jgi:hypothetical protein
MGRLWKNSRLYRFQDFLEEVGPNRLTPTQVEAYKGSPITVSGDGVKARGKKILEAYVEIPRRTTRLIQVLRFGRGEGYNPRRPGVPKKEGHKA